MLFLNGFLTSAQGRSLRAKRAGKRRAAFWRGQGLPNLMLPRAAIAAKRQRAQARAAGKRNFGAMERNAPTKSPPTSTPYRRDDRPTACCPTICQIEPPPRQCEWSHYPSLQCYFDGAGNHCTFFKNADTAVPREIVEKQIL